MENANGWGLVTFSQVPQIPQGIDATTYFDEAERRFASEYDVRPITMERYLAGVHRFRNWMRMQGVDWPDRATMKEYKQALRDQNYGASTQNQYFIAVKVFFGWLAAEGYYVNIADRVKGAKVKQGEHKRDNFEKEEIVDVLKSLDTSTEAGLRDYLMITLATSCGLRIIELSRANVGDVIEIGGVKRLYVQGKGRDEKDESFEVVPELAQMLDRYLDTRKHPNGKREPLFTGVGNRRTEDGRLSEPAISRILKGVVKKAGYDSNRLTAHSFRHSAITFYARENPNLREVQAFARHSDPKTTEIYIHEDEKKQRHPERVIYRYIFNPDAPDVARDCYEALQGMTTDQQKAAYEYIMQMQKGAECIAV